MRLFEGAIGGKVLLNIQAKSVESAVQATELFGNAVLAGVMAKDFPHLNEGVSYIHELHRRGVQVSAGLGDGSADQWNRALAMALQTNPVHLNQIFPAAALSQFYLHEKGMQTVVNGLVSPTGKPGWVNVGTGPMSLQTAEASVPVESAVAMLKEMGVHSIKLFPVEGTKRMEEIRAAAKAVAQAGMVLEPTGGLSPENVADVVGLCLNEGVPFIMPHLYGSLKNKDNGDFEIEKLKQAHKNVRALF